MSDWYEAEESRGFGGSPFAARAVGQRHHHGLEFRAANLKGNITSVKEHTFRILYLHAKT